MNTGGPAFPTSSGWNPNGDWVADNSVNDGMTLRDYFAAKAMQGLLACDIYAPKDQFAKNAYAMADAMMKAREQ